MTEWEKKHLDRYNAATNDFERHLILIKVQDGELHEGTARFKAWQEGPEGFEKRKAELEN